MITQAGAHRVLTMDLHAGQIQGFFDIPTDNLYAVPEIVRDIEKQKDRDNVMVVSPDVGGVVRARALAKRLSTGLAIVDKRRDKPGSSEVMNIIGDVSEVSAYITHGVLSGKAVDRINASDLSSLVITDTIGAADAVTASSKIREISIAPMFAKAITRIANGESVSVLFE